MMSQVLKWVVIIAIILGGLGYTAGVTPSAKPAMTNMRPECPHDWGEFLVARPQKGGGYDHSVGVADTEGAGTVVAVDGGPDAPYGFKLPNATSNVPEYHDCQRMRLESAAAPSYGSLIAVFAGDSLRDMDSTVFAEPRPAAEVFVPEPGGYDKLLIVNTFSCLVLQRVKHDDWKAWMVPVQRQNQCAQAFTAANLKPAFELSVVATTPSAGQVVPAVARWDWDAKAKTQLIGVRCAEQWCTVGPKGLTPSESYIATGMIADAAANFEIKGYYDEQQLAEFPGGVLTPATNVGTLVPSAQLGAAIAPKNFTAYNGTWVHVADVYMRREAGSYEKSLNFIGDPVGPPKGEHAEIWLCRSGDTRCRPDMPFLYFRSRCHASTADGATWYAKITRPGAKTKYFCTVYRPHAGAQIPPVARWRWRTDDEGVWVSCPEGCCETNADQ
ncbi:MAG: hypothetical protein H3C62_07920 [Gemmatimonadaceae bacterium]|nr:hypothetical protein [Gemmatimonadaceae bacterium]